MKSRLFIGGRLKIINGCPPASRDAVMTSRVSDVFSTATSASARLQGYLADEKTNPPGTLP